MAGYYLFGIDYNVSVALNIKNCQLMKASKCLISLVIDTVTQELFWVVSENLKPYLAL